MNPNKSKFEKIQENFINALFTEDELWEMAGVHQEESGLKVYVYISAAQGSHGPRIKFVNGYTQKMTYSDLIPMTISDNPEIPSDVHTKIKISNKDLNNLKEWIILNKTILLELWNGNFKSESEAKQLLKKVENNESK